MSQKQREVVGPAFELLTKMGAIEAQWRDGHPWLSACVRAFRKALLAEVNAWLTMHGAEPMADLEDKS